ncbi:hypothetical protein TIFTF001_017685, partial [Ficus carica]
MVAVREWHIHWVGSNLSWRQCPLFVSPIYLLSDVVDEDNSANVDEYSEKPNDVVSSITSPNINEYEEKEDKHDQYNYAADEPPAGRYSASTPAQLFDTYTTTGPDQIHHKEAEAEPEPEEKHRYSVPSGGYSETTTELYGDSTST